MKTIPVTIREIFNLRALRFKFDFHVSRGSIFITANSEKLREIGY